MIKPGFDRELKRYGPDGKNRGGTLADARSYCRHLALTHGDTPFFHWLIDRPLQQHAHHLSAFYWWSIDLATHPPGHSAGVAGTLALLRWWRGELLDCYRGHLRHPVMRALRETVEEFGIPPRPFLDLVFALEQDVLVKHYKNYEQLLNYCRLAANPIGNLVLHLYRSYDPERARLADQISTGLCLAMLWQNLGRHLRRGHVYLPEEDRIRFGYTEADLEARRHTPAFVNLMRFQVHRAREFLYRGLPLRDHVPWEMQVEMDLLIRGGMKLLQAIERCPYDYWSNRPRLGGLTRASLCLRAAWRCWRGQPSCPPMHSNPSPGVNAKT
jgi:squalene synthase HpnC